MQELQRKLRALMPPGVAIGSDPKPQPKVYKLPLQQCYKTKAVRELGLKPIPIDDTLRDTVSALVNGGFVTPRPGEGNWDGAEAWKNYDAESVVWSSSGSKL